MAERGHESISRVIQKREEMTHILGAERGSESVSGVSFREEKRIDDARTGGGMGA